MSRIFQAMRESEKASGKEAPNPPTSNGGQLPDLMASLESWSAGLEGPRAGTLQSVPPASASVSPRAGVLGALGDLDNPQQTVEQPVDPAEHWAELAATDL